MKTALITGGAKGIGAAAARHIAELGYNIAVNYKTSRDEAEVLCQSLRDSGIQALALCADVTDEKAVASMCAEVESRLSPIEVLVNNAGISRQRLFTDITGDEWDEMLSVNLKSAYICSRTVLPGMISRKYGRIINISSVWGQTGGSMETHYSASKAGLIGLTSSLAKELAPSGITVNCVAPGVIDTDMMKCFSDADRAQLCDEIPLGRLGTPDEAAAAVKFFASSAAAYITGQTLAVNGGFYV